MPQEDKDEQKGDEKKVESSFQKRAAEAFTLVVSLLIVGGLAVYLAMQSRLPTSDFVHVRAQVLWAEAQRKNESTIVPIEVENTSRAALSQLQVQVSFEENGQPQERDISFDYVAGGSKRRAYLLFKRSVQVLQREAELKVEPSFYVVE